MTFRLTPAAEADLVRIADFLAREASPDVADMVLDAFVRAFVRLADMPRIGHARRDLTDESLLFWPVYGYLIVYRPDEQPLQVVRMVHGARDPNAILKALRDAP